MKASSFATPAVLAVAMALAGCGGDGPSGKDNPFQPDPEPEAQADPAQAATSGDNTSFTQDDDGDGIPNALEDDGDRDANGIENSLQEGLNAFALSADGATLAVEINGLDGTPLAATYARNPAMDTGGYLAYSLQEDALDRLFVALGRESNDGSTRAYLVHGHSQFNRFINGGLYERDGDFDPPALGTGPGQGQVSYAGSYAGYTNIGTVDGDNLIGGTGGQDEAVRPREDARVVGNIFLNANFADNEVNGAIYNRVAIDPTGAGNDVAFEDMTLLLTTIEPDGTFFGDVEVRGVIDEDKGDYGGIFGGPGAASVAGLASFKDFDSRYDNEIEHGVFVLTQCGRPDDDAICDLVAP